MNVVRFSMPKCMCADHVGWLLFPFFLCAPLEVVAKKPERRINVRPPFFMHALFVSQFCSGAKKKKVHT